MKKKFKEIELIEIDRKELLFFLGKSEENKRVFHFVNVLGKFWNNLSFLVWAADQLENCYEQPNKTISNHTGVYNGFYQQTFMYFLSHLYEIDGWMKDGYNRETVSIIRKRYLTNRYLKRKLSFNNKLKSDVKNFLKNGEIIPSELASNLKKIRDTISFHYPEWKISRKRIPYEEYLESFDGNLFYNELSQESIFRKEKFSRIYYSDFFDGRHLGIVDKMDKNFFNNLTVRVAAIVAVTVDLLHQQIFESFKGVYSEDRKEAK